MRLAVTLLAGLAVILACVAAWLYTPDKSRAGLVATYAQPPSRFVDVAGGILHLRDTGPRGAPAIILLHGFGASLHTWDAWAELLSADYRVIRFDLPGFGLTGADPTGDYTDARAVAIILALLDQLGLGQAVLVGNSMGGRIAWTFAAAHPDRVSRLVLISPDGFASPGLTYGTPPDVPLIMRLLPYTLPLPMLRSSLEAAYGDPSRLTGQNLQTTRDMMLAPGVRAAVLDRMRQMVLQDPRPLLARITAPVLLLWGTLDAMIPISNAQDYLAALPHGTLVTLPGTGHVPQEETPAPSAAALRSFIAG